MDLPTKQNFVCLDITQTNGTISEQHLEDFANIRRLVRRRRQRGWDEWKEAAKNARERLKWWNEADSEAGPADRKYYFNIVKIGFVFSLAVTVILLLVSTVESESTLDSSEPYPPDYPPLSKFKSGFVESVWPTNFGQIWWSQNIGI
jgi:hypothetical protein